MKLYTSKEVREKYSRDRSLYKIKPKAVAFPSSEKDIQKIIEFARKKKLSITPRGGGTGLSGASIGKGIVLDITKKMNKIFSLGKISKVQAGVKLENLHPKLKKKGYFLPSVPLYEKSAIGGNINTSTVGPRAVKYGAINNEIKYLKGVLADGRIIDTSKKIPEDLTKELRKIQKEFKKDKKIKDFLKKRPSIAGGYNLNAFYNKNINHVVKDLLIGSTGTLAILTEVVLKTFKYKILEEVYLLYFNNYDELQKSLNKALKKGVATVEYAGEETFKLWDKKYREKNVICTLILGFETKKNIKDILKHSINYKKISKKDRGDLWRNRMGALIRLEKAAKRQGVQLPSGIDDATFNPKDFSKIMKDITRYSKKTGIQISSFGHIGVGSVHFRPFINLKKDLKKFDRLAMDVFKILRKYNGTLIGEHNSGFCRSRYLELENKRMYGYMKKIKRVFDPKNILNPKVMFNLDPITKNLDL